MISKDSFVFGKLNVGKADLDFRKKNGEVSEDFNYIVIIYIMSIEYHILAGFFIYASLVECFSYFGYFVVCSGLKSWTLHRRVRRKSNQCWKCG